MNTIIDELALQRDWLHDQNASADWGDLCNNEKDRNSYQKEDVWFYILDAIFLEKYCDSKQLNEPRANDVIVNHMYVLV